jgi:sugar (pentulose or hexulose) kinase
VTPPTGSPRLTGGGSRNPVFMAIKANVFGRPVTIIDEPESTALGAAFLGGVAGGVYADVETAVSGLDRRETTVEPDQRIAERYDALRVTVFEPASGALKPVEAALAAWREE